MAALGSIGQNTGTIPAAGWLLGPPWWYDPRIIVGIKNDGLRGSQALLGFSIYSTVGVPTAVAWNWNFGDGTTSTLQSPTHSYAAEGSYTVSLTTTWSNGVSDIETKVAYITGALGPATVTGSSSLILTVSIGSSGVTTPVKQGSSTLIETVSITTAAGYGVIPGTSTLVEVVSIGSSAIVFAHSSSTLVETVSILSAGRVYTFSLVPAVEEEFVLVPVEPDNFVLTPADEDTFVLTPLYD